VLLLIGGWLTYLYVGPPWRYVIVAALAGVEVGQAIVWIRWRRRRAITGADSLVGATGRMTGPDRVQLRGTSWRARGLDVAPGDEVVVEAVEGMTLVVRRR
jgi:membrane protein implicated in regulation of membrane protease activity